MIKLNKIFLVGLFSTLMLFSTLGDSFAAKGKRKAKNNKKTFSGTYFSGYGNYTVGNEDFGGGGGVGYTFGFPWVRLDLGITGEYNSLSSSIAEKANKDYYGTYNFNVAAIIATRFVSPYVKYSFVIDAIGDFGDVEYDNQFAVGFFVPIGKKFAPYFEYRISMGSDFAHFDFTDAAVLEFGTRVTF